MRVKHSNGTVAKSRRPAALHLTSLQTRNVNVSFTFCALLWLLCLIAPLPVLSSSFTLASPSSTPGLSSAAPGSLPSGALAEAASSSQTPAQDTTSPLFSFDNDRALMLERDAHGYFTFGRFNHSIRNTTRNFPDFATGMHDWLSPFDHNSPSFHRVPVDPTQPWISLVDPNFYRSYVEQDGFHGWHFWFMGKGWDGHAATPGRVRMSPWNIPMVAQARLRPGNVPALPWDIVRAIGEKLVIEFNVFFLVSPAYLGYLGRKFAATAASVCAGPVAYHNRDCEDAYHEFLNTLFLRRNVFPYGQIQYRAPPQQEYLDILNNPKLNGDGVTYELGFYKENVLTSRDHLDDDLPQEGQIYRDLSAVGVMALYQYMRNTQDQHFAVFRELANYFQRIKPTIRNTRPGDLFYRVATADYIKAMEGLLKHESLRNGTSSPKPPDTWAVKLRTQSIIRYPGDFRNQRVSVPPAAATHTRLWPYPNIATSRRHSKGVQRRSFIRRVLT